MARPVQQVLWDQWQRRIERQRRSGRSIAAFCRIENVSPQAFYVWKRKLRDAAIAREQEGLRKNAATEAFPRRFVASQRSFATTATCPLPTRPVDFLQLPVTAAPTSPWIELALADGTILRLPQQNVAALVAVLRVLRGERWAGAEGGHA